MQNYNGLLGLELRSKMTDLGRIFIMHNMFICELTVKALEIKADQNSTKLPKIQKLREIIKRKFEKFTQK